MSNDLAVKKSQLTNAVKQMSDYLKDKIDNNTTQLNAIELNFDNLEVSKTVSDIIDDSIVNQKYLGGYIEIQPDSYNGGSVPSTNNTDNVWGFPYSLLESEQKKIKDAILNGKGTGIMYIRLPLGFAYRGYRNIDDTSKLAKNIGERYAGQNSALKSFFEDIVKAGGGLAPEYWCPAPYWVTGGAYNGNNQLWAGGSNARTVTLASIKESDNTQYKAQINAFTDAIVDDLEYLHENVAPVRMFGLQNEPGSGKTEYGACKYDAQTYNDVLEVLIPKIKASEKLKVYNGVENEVKIHVCSENHDPVFGISDVFSQNHPELIWGYSHHLTKKINGELNDLGADWYKSEDFKTIKGNKKNVFMNEYEHFDINKGSDDFRCSNNMLRLIFEAVYGGAEVLHPIIHICKQIGQSGYTSNTSGYGMFACNLKGEKYGLFPDEKLNEYGLEKGTATKNTAMYNSWALFGENLPVNSVMVGKYTTTSDNTGWCAYRYGGKLYLFMANKSDKAVKIKLTFNTEKEFEGKAYSMELCGEKIKTKKGKTIDFIIPAYSGQCWIETKLNKVKFNDTPVVYSNLRVVQGGVDPTTGATTTATNGVRTEDIEVNESFLTVISNLSESKLCHLIRYYDKDKNYLGKDTNSLTNGSSDGVRYCHELPSGTRYIKLLLYKEGSRPNVTADYFYNKYIRINNKYYKLVSM